MDKELKQHFADYINECRYLKRRSEQTIRGYEYVFEHFMKIMPEVRFPHEVKRVVIIEFFKRIQTRTRMVGKRRVVTGVKDSTVHTYASKLNSFFEWMRLTGRVYENPFEKVSFKYPDYTDNRRLSQSEIGKIYTAIKINAANHFLYHRNTAIVSMFLYTGIRRGELLGLRVMDIDLIKGLVTVRGETSKSKRDRQVPINPFLRKDLEDYLKSRKERKYKSEYLFVSDNGDRGFTAHGLKHLVQTLILQSGVKFHVHRFRHTFACAMAKSGASIIQIQKVLGHVDIRMTQTYLRSLAAEDYREQVLNLSLNVF